MAFTQRITMSNPLLNMQGLPPFSKIKAEHVEPAINELLDQNRNQIQQQNKLNYNT